jgi:ABC-2 type transport system ATP-binding protein
MDEAERCHELVYIAYGRVLARGTESQIVEAAGLTVFELTGPGAAAEAEALKAAPGVQSVAAFGASLHVAGQDAARCSAPWPRWPSAPACRWRPRRPIWKTCSSA